MKWFWQQLTRTDHAGFVNAGDDARWNPFGLFGWIQSKLSFHSDRDYWVSFTFKFLGLTVFAGIPPFLVINIALPRGRYAVARFGYRFDGNWKGFIFPEEAFKVLDHPILY